MDSLIIIPARMKSVRLPNKPLADIAGKPMIVHVMERAQAANAGPVVIAAAEQELVDVIQAHGGEAVLTDPALPSGTDRVKAAADIYDPEGQYELVVNVQGDLPTLDPSIISETLATFSEGRELDFATPATVISDPEELTTPNVVKIALSPFDCGTTGRALYFSRSTIPHGGEAFYHHIGLYAFKRQALDKFVSLPVNPLETQERLEQLRALAHGMEIHVKIVDTKAPFGVDTPEDLEKAREILG